MFVRPSPIAIGAYGAPVLSSMHHFPALANLAACLHSQRAKEKV